MDGWTTLRARGQKMRTSKSTGSLKFLEKSTRLKIYATRALCAVNVLSGLWKISKFTAYGEEKTKANSGARFPFLTLVKKLGARGFRIALIVVVVLISLE